MAQDFQYIEPLDHRLFHILYEYQQGLIRGDLVKLVDAPRTTIWDHIQKWKPKGLIYEYTRPHGGRSRPYTFFALTKKGIQFAKELQTENQL